MHCTNRAIPDVPSPQAAVTKSRSGRPWANDLASNLWAFLGRIHAITAALQLHLFRLITRNLRTSESRLRADPRSAPDNRMQGR